MSNTEHIYFLIGILGLLVTVGVVFTFALPVPNHRYKAQSPVFGRLFLISVWFAFLAICLEPLGYPLASAATLNLCILLAMYMLLMVVMRRYGLPLRPLEAAGIVCHLILCEAVSLYFYLVNDQVLIRELIVSACVLVPLGMALKLIYRHIPQNKGGDEMIFVVVAITTVGVVFGVPVYLSMLEEGESVSTNVAFVAIFFLTILFMLGFPTSLMQSLFQRLSTQVYIDALTGTKNRHFLYKEAPKMLSHTRRHNQPLSLVACDIDYFKAVNDKFGHPMGDIALRRFTEIVETSLRDGDTMIRMGGEEFLILLPNSKLMEASTLAERLCEQVRSSEIQLEKASINLTASFGVAEIGKDETIFEGIRYADEALYRAKASGRDQVKRAQS